MPKHRVNRCIELLEQEDYLFYANAGELTRSNGRKHAKTWADFLMVDFEHDPFNVAGLRAFMQGLTEGGPTRSGHRTPAVIATLPSNARTPHEVHVNAWQVRHVLASGVHGILHTHVRQADAARAFVEECRYPFPTTGLGGGLRQGQRGSGGQSFPAGIWGIPASEYTRLADPWPLNPDGELMLGLKIEDREGAANAKFITKVPGIAFAEWGPSDMAMSYGHADAQSPPYPSEMEIAGQLVKQACDVASIVLLDGPDDKPAENEDPLNPESCVRSLMELGVRIISGGSEEMARIGRRISGRTMPV